MRFKTTPPESLLKDVLSKVEGVKSVALYPKQHMVGVEFAAKGQVTDQQLSTS